uniref:Streptophobe family protein n=1 Tax=Streptomyces sp. NBC_00049 TaxID=2903617 RepID=A0AAU2JK97_9ACTN
MRRIRWGDVLLSGVAAVGWSVIVMAAVAGLGLHLLGADATGGSLGPMTAAVVALAMGGTVTPSGDISVFGVTGPDAVTSLDVTPLGVTLAGALVLAAVFLRSLRAGAPAGELVARGAVVAALMVGTAGALAWAGHDAVTLDGPRLPKVPPKVEIPGIGDVGGLLPDRIGELIETRARVGFSVELAPTLVGAGVWVSAVLAVALLVSRRGPAAFARLRPAASAVVAMLLVAVVAGLAAAMWAASGDQHPRQVAGAALLGAPNGAWLGVLLGLFVPLHGRATGTPARLLPDPLDELLVSSREPVTLSRLAEYDGRVWLLVAGVGLLLLYAGALAAVRTPGRGTAQCAARLAAVTGAASVVLVWLTGFSADASLAVLGVDAVDAGVELWADPLYALVLGAAWGGAAGAAGALLTRRLRPAADRPGAFAGPPAGPGGAGRPGGAGPSGWPGGPGAPGRPGGSGASGRAGGPAASGGRGGPGGSGAPGGGSGARGRPGRRREPDPAAGPDAPTAPYGGGAPGGRGHRPAPEPDGSWDVTVTGFPPGPPRGPRAPKPPRRPPFTPPPPPAPPPPPPPPAP